MESFGMGGIIIYVLIFIALIYFVMIRPQKKRQKEHDNLVNTLSLGVEIVTIGGIHGEVSRIKDDTLWIKVSNNVEIEIEKSAVGRTIS